MNSGKSNFPEDRLLQNVSIETDKKILFIHLSPSQRVFQVLFFQLFLLGSDAAGCLFTAVAVLSVVTVLVVSIFFAGCAAAFGSMAATVFGSDGVVVFCAEGVVEAAVTATSLTGDACRVSVAGFCKFFLGIVLDNLFYIFN